MVAVHHHAPGAGECTPIPHCSHHPTTLARWQAAGTSLVAMQLPGAAHNAASPCPSAPHHPHILTHLHTLETCMQAVDTSLVAMQLPGAAYTAASPCPSAPHHPHILTPPHTLETCTQAVDTSPAAMVLPGAAHTEALLYPPTPRLPTPLKCAVHPHFQHPFHTIHICLHSPHSFTPWKRERRWLVLRWWQWCCQERRVSSATPG